MANLLAQPSLRRRVVRGRSSRPKLRQQLLRARGRRRISLFGLDSGAALATVVGVLVEVPVMQSVVRIEGDTRLV